MQRAAAIKISNGGSTPSKLQVSGYPPAKRQKLSTNSTPASPSVRTPSAPGTPNGLSTPSPMTGTTMTRTGRKTYISGGEEEWYLSWTRQNGGSTDSGQIEYDNSAAEEEDDGENDIWQEKARGRMTFGSYQRGRTQDFGSVTPNGVQSTGNGARDLLSDSELDSAELPESRPHPLRPLDNRPSNKKRESTVDGGGEKAQAKVRQLDRMDIQKSFGGGISGAAGRQNKASGKWPKKRS